MADQRITFEVWLENGQFKTALSDSTNAARNFGATVGQSGSAMSSLATFAKGFVGVGLATAFLSIAKSALSTYAALEKNKVAIETMLGSSSKAREMLKEIEVYAAKTPFEQMGLIDAAKLLLNFGIEGEKVMPLLKTIGEVAGGDQQKLHSMALAFGQMSSAGRLMGQDLLQMINAGFNPLEEISRKTGKSMGVLRQEMEKGKISVKMVEDAFKSATGEGGRYYGLLERQSQTISGLMSTLSDNIVMASNVMIENMSPALKDLMRDFVGATEVGGAFSQAMKFVGTDMGYSIDKMRIAGHKISSLGRDLQIEWKKLTSDTFVTHITDSKGKEIENPAHNEVKKLKAEQEKAEKEIEAAIKRTQAYEKAYSKDGYSAANKTYQKLAEEENKKNDIERGPMKARPAATPPPDKLHGLSRDKFLSEFGKLGMTETEQAAFDQTKRQADLAKYEKHLKQLNISEAEYNKAKKAINDEYDQKVLESHAKAITRTGKLFDDMLKSAGSLVQTLGDNQVKAIEKAKELGDQLLDAQKDYLIASAGLAEETANQKIDKEIGALEKKFNAEKNFAKRTEIEAELTAKRKEKKRLDIEKEYAEKKWLFDLMMDTRRRQKAAENFRLQQGIQIAQAISSTALAATNVLASESKINFYYALAAMAAAIIAGGVQVGIIASQSPPMASGGFVPGSLPGSAKILAEGGRSEAVIPFENETYMSKFRSALGMDNQVVNTNIYLDGKLLGRQTDEYRRDRAYRQGVRDYSARSAY